MATLFTVLSTGLVPMTMSPAAYEGVEDLPDDVFGMVCRGVGLDAGAHSPLAPMLVPGRY